MYILSVTIDSTGTHSDSIVYDNGYYYAPTTDAYSGNYALLLANSYNVTANKMTTGAAAVDTDSVFSAWGSLEFIPLQSRPENLAFYYKYLSIGNDSGAVSCVLYDDAGNVVGEATQKLGEQATYAAVNIPFVYVSANAVANYSLSFHNFVAIDSTSQAHFGTRMWIDELGFNKTTDIENVSPESGIHIYPNPAQTFFAIATKESVKSIFLYEINGKNVILSTENKQKIAVNHLPHGLYFLKVETEKGIYWRELWVD